MLSRRNVAFALLIVSLSGMAATFQGFRLVDTLVLLVCGIIAGCSLAEIATARKGPPRIKT